MTTLTFVDALGLIGFFALKISAMLIVFIAFLFITAFAVIKLQKQIDDEDQLTALSISVISVLLFFLSLPVLSQFTSVEALESMTTTLANATHHLSEQLRGNPTQVASQIAPELYRSDINDRS